MKVGSLRLLRAAILLAAAFLLPAPAQAGFIYGLTVSGSWTGSGSIEFDTLSGSTAAGVSAFSFHTSTGAGSPQDYGLADLAAVTWSIDPSFDLSLLLSTSLVPFGLEQSAVLLTNQPGFHTLECDFGTISAANSIACRVFSNGFEFSTSGVLSADLVAITSVPEPGTLALFGFGLAGLGLMRRRRLA